MDKILYEDINLAKRIVSGETNLDRDYSDISGIFPVTNEEISAKPYIKAILNKERILSVIASGDQIINSILFGSRDIEAYDISRFPKYYLYLKLAAIESLSLRDFIKFFYLNDTSKIFFYSKLYSKIRKKLDVDTKIFWDSLFNDYTIYDIFLSNLFRCCVSDTDSFKRNKYDNNPYLNIKNYLILKNKIKGVKIKLYQGSIFDLINSDMKGYNLVNLSNIIDNYSIKEYDKYDSFIKSIPLLDNGIVLTYLISYNYSWKLNGRLDQFDDDYEKIVFDEKEDSDGLLLYKKRLR